METIFRCVYFTDHQIEWKTFTETPNRGFVKDMSAPIAFCEFRERTFYSNYAEELFYHEPSGLAAKASKEMAALYALLNAEVHASHVASLKSLKPAWDAPVSSKLNDVAKLVQKVGAQSCIVLAALFRNKFDKLPPVHRAWFDWLVGSNIAKSIRSGRFGI